MVNSIRKGKNAEREASKIISKLTGKTWKRVPSSGALFTTQKSAQFAGDLYSEEMPDLIIEVKHHKEPLTVSELFGTPKRFGEWLKQTIYESQGKDWILMIKSQGEWYLVTKTSHDFLNDFYHFNFGNLMVFQYKKK